MDPDACLKLLVDALAQKRWLNAVDHLEDLTYWAQRGGFRPTDAKTILALRGIDIDILPGSMGQQTKWILDWLEA